MRQGTDGLKSLSTDLNGCVRSNPEALFAKSILVCEGATEVGICKALNEYRIQQGKQNAAFKGVRFVDGCGSTQVNYARKFRELGYNVCLFCDSDVDNINDKKEELSNLGIKVVECSPKNSIEMQIFNDLPWSGAQKLITYHLEDAQTSITSVSDSLRTKILSLSDNWLEADASDIRGFLGKTSHKESWFKRIDHGIFLGETCCEYLQEMGETTLKNEFTQLSEWIENA